MVFGNREPAVLQHVSQRARLPLCQTTARKSLRRKPALPSACRELGRKALESCGEELDPAGHVHMRPSHGLQRAVECCPIPVIVLAESKESLEVVAGAIEAQRRKQPGRAPIAVEEWMDVHQLELR